jgi:hypothetical protein
MYGLGWYVQDFDGIQLLWHTGRWPPSTSALYLKIPGEDLTFIVFANTDNLTTPFVGIGHGDVTKSLLALSFFQHFIFPEIYRNELPVIDWNASEGFIVNQLSEVDDEPVREFLERELWAFRQAYASVGQQDQVTKLLRVNLRAFPNSSMRKDDLFTHTVGEFPVISPGLPATAFVWLNRGILVWSLMVLISLVWILIKLVRGEPFSKKRWIYWLLSTIFLGLFSVLIYERTQSGPLRSIPSYRQQAWIESTFIAGIYAIGWALAISVLKSIGNDPHPLSTLGVTYLSPLMVSLVFFRIPRLLSLGLDGFKDRLSGGLSTGVISMNIAFAVMFPLSMIFDRVLAIIPGSFNMFYWTMLSFLSLANLITQYPINRRMILRGLIVWGPNRTRAHENFNSPPRKNVWPLLVASVFIMIASLAVIVSQFA